MQTYKLETTITKDGKIILPSFLKRIFNHKIEILLLDKEKNQESLEKLSIPYYKCGGKIADFNRSDLYEKGL